MGKILVIFNMAPTLHKLAPVLASLLILAGNIFILALKKSSSFPQAKILNIAAITKIIADVLGGPQGLAEIFAGEQTAGIFDSTVAAQASGDITANVIGELAKITGERETTQDSITKKKTKESDVSAKASFSL